MGKRKRLEAKRFGSVCMDTKKVDTDAISRLPREILGYVLSLLPTKLAASTCVLSKNWRNVFALVRNLDFDDSVLLQPQEDKDMIRECFRSFVDRTLALQCASRLDKFSLKCHIDDDSQMTYVAPWIRNAVERGVLELYIILLKPRCDIFDLLNLPVNIQTHHGQLFLPHELFSSKTLVKLTLGARITLEMLPPDVFLPALKSLFIHSVRFHDGDLCCVLLPGCPVLEDLVVRHEDYQGPPHCISSRSIKKLSVYYDCGIFSGMSFDAPSLVSLDYSDYASPKYAPVNLASLVEARLDIDYSEKFQRPDVSGLINGIRNVQILHLSPESVDVISKCVEHGLSLPVFKNLVKLSFGSKDQRGWTLLPYLLDKSPKIETLIIQGLDGYTGDVAMRPYQVKVLQVLGYGGTATELEHLKSIISLGKLERLGLLQVELPQDLVVDDAFVSQTYRDLIRHLGVVPSSKYKIEVAYFT